MVARTDAEAGSVEQRIEKVGRDLSAALTRLLDDLPGAPHRPQLLARALGVNVVLTSRLLKAAHQTDPLAAIHAMPGPEPLRRILRAALRRKVDPALIERAGAAVDRFEQLIDADGGDRSGLDALISGWLPDARARVELIAKQSVFRGMSQLLGTSCEVEHFAAIVHPGAGDPSRADQVWLNVIRGLRRVRPGLPVPYDTVHPTGPVQTLDGGRVEDIRGLLLEEFCTRPLPRLDVRASKDVIWYTVGGDGVGVRSAVDFAHATLHPGRHPVSRPRGSPAQWASMAIGVSRPARVFVIDAIVHDDVYPDAAPALEVRRTVGVFGEARAHGNERFDVVESVLPLGRGLGSFRCADTPGYRQILAHICGRRGWDRSKFRGYRCRIEYPVYSAEVALKFEVPEERGATTA